MTSLNDLNIKFYADSANLETMFAWYKDPQIRGFTTNPTLMREAGVANYQTFALDALAVIKDKPISFEVFSDDFDEMYREACIISEWGDNVFVKIPVMNRFGQSSANLIRQLAKKGVKQNVTAVMTVQQVEWIAENLCDSKASTISIFAGRIADTGLDPIPIMQDALNILKKSAPHLELIWASPREILNIFQANLIGCHIITLTNNLLKKLNCIGKNLELFSLETVTMFSDDAKKSGFYLLENENDIKKIPA